MGSRMSWVAIAVAAVAVGLALVFCVAVIVGGLGFAWLTVRTGPGDQYVSNGQMIYFTGRNERGQRIPFDGGPMWLYMRGGGCAACHGADGRGGAPVMMGAEIPGDIRFYHLTEEEHEEGEEHPPYTEALIKRAIARGLNPAGEPLDITMPRWHMSEGDLDDLILFLKTLNGG